MKFLSSFSQIHSNQFMGMWPHPIPGQDCSFAVVLGLIPFSLIYIYFMGMDVLYPCTILYLGSVNIRRGHQFLEVKLQVVVRHHV